MSIKANYIKFPREFTTEPLSSLLSPYAKILYVILSDRLEGSEKNKDFQDNDGTPFVYFAVDDLALVLGCGIATVTRVLNELQNVGLIYRHRQYACKGTKIYVHDVKKVMLKLVENREKCAINLMGQCNQIDGTVQSNRLDSAINLMGQCNQFEQQSISKLSKEKNQKKSTSQNYQADTPPQQEQTESACGYETSWEQEQKKADEEWEREQEEQKKRQKKAETKMLLIDYFSKAFEKISDENDRELLLNVLYDIYSTNRHTYTINGKEITRNEIYHKIFRLHETQVTRAVETLQEVRAKKHIQNEFIYLLTTLYNC